MKMENIHPGAKIHPHAEIHNTAIIYDGVTIEQNVYIGPYCIIGSFAEWKGHEARGKGVIIGKGTIITGLITIDAGAEQQTIIGADCYIMKHAHVGHDATIENNVTISCGAKIGGHASIGHHCNIGLNACIHQRQLISPGCMIGANAFVSKTLITQPYRKYAGVPAKDIGSNAK